ncbi:MAG: helix-turn-helix transcriptional regulator [Methylococcaceae bacterium]
MKVCEKIKFMRQVKELSQEKMAEKLGLSLNGYTKIERGETNPSMPRIKQIAEVFEMDFMELVSFGEKNVVFLTGGENHTFLTNFNNISNGSIDLAHELEKSQLLNADKDKEIALLKRIIELMEAKNITVTDE